MAAHYFQNKSELSRMTASGAGGNEVEFTVQLVGPTSYATGGMSLTATEIKAQLGIDSISFLSCEVNAASATDVQVVIYDRTNNKLVVLDETGTQIGNATDLSGRTYRLRIVGVRKADLSTLP